MNKRRTSKSNNLFVAGKLSNIDYKASRINQLKEPFSRLRQRVQSRTRKRKTIQRFVGALSAAVHQSKKFFTNHPSHVAK